MNSNKTIKDISGTNLSLGGKYVTVELPIREVTERIGANKIIKIPIPKVNFSDDPETWIIDLKRREYTWTIMALIAGHNKIWISGSLSDSGTEYTLNHNNTCQLLKYFALDGRGLNRLRLLSDDLSENYYGCVFIDLLEIKSLHNPTTEDPNATYFQVMLKLTKAIDKR